MSSAVLPQIRLSSPSRRQAFGMRYGRLYADPRPNPFAGGGHVHAEVPARSSQALEFSAPNDDRDVRSLGFALLKRRGPSAIFRAVGAVRVNSVDRAFVSRSKPHVGQERIERIVPPVAHDDSSPAPCRVVLVGHIKASALHAKPRSIFGCDAVPAFVTVAGHGIRSFGDVVRVGSEFGCPLRSEAPARPDRPVSQVRARHQFFGPAVAGAHPHAGRPRLLQNQKSAESKSCHLDKFHWHMIPRKWHP